VNLGAPARPGSRQCHGAHNSMPRGCGLGELSGLSVGLLSPTRPPRDRLVALSPHRAGGRRHAAAPGEAFAVCVLPAAAGARSLPGAGQGGARAAPGVASGRQSNEARYIWQKARYILCLVLVRTAPAGWEVLAGVPAP
jgi:hypothetical protein